MKKQIFAYAIGATFCILIFLLFWYQQRYLALELKVKNLEAKNNSDFVKKIEDENTKLKEKLKYTKTAASYAAIIIAKSHRDDGVVKYINYITDENYGIMPTHKYEVFKLTALPIPKPENERDFIGEVIRSYNFTLLKSGKSNIEVQPK